MGNIAGRQAGKHAAGMAAKRVTREVGEEVATTTAKKAAQASANEAIEAAAKGGAAGAMKPSGGMLSSLYKNPIKAGAAAYVGYDLLDDSQVNFSPSGGFGDTIGSIFDTIPFLKPVLLGLLLLFIIK